MCRTDGTRLHVAETGRMVLVEADVECLRQPTTGIAKGETEMVSDKVDGASMSAAHEAVVAVFVAVEGERRGAVVMKRAEAFVPVYM